MSGQTFAGPNDPLYLSTRGVNSISFNKLAAPPLAYNDKGILYELDDGTLNFNGVPISGSGVDPVFDAARLTINALPHSTPTPGIAIKQFQEDNDVGAGDVVAIGVSYESGTAQAGGTTTLTLDAGASSTDNLYVDMWLLITSGLGANQVRQVTAYNGTTKVATISSAWTFDPDTADYDLYYQNYYTVVAQNAGSGAQSLQISYALNADDEPTTDECAPITVGSVQTTNLNYALLINKGANSMYVNTINTGGTKFLNLPWASDTLVAKATTDALTNKTIIGATNTVEASALQTTGASVNVVAAAPPSAGQVLMATAATTATWQTATDDHTDSHFNVFVGDSAGNLTVTGTNSVGVGVGSCAALTIGHSNTAIGTGTLESATIGSENTCAGYGAGTNITAASNSTIIGNQAGNNVTIGNSNTLVGDLAGKQITDGEFNTVLGANALSGTFAGGYNNLILGADSGSALATSESFCVLLNNPGVTAESAVVRIGTDAHTNATWIAGIRGKTTAQADAIPVLVDSLGQLGTAVSSIVYKENVRDLDYPVDVSGIVDGLRPVAFNYKTQPGKETIGLIAEEVEKVYPGMCVYQNGWLGGRELLTVDYARLPILLLAEVQKLKAEVSRLRKGSSIYATLPASEEAEKVRVHRVAELGIDDAEWYRRFKCITGRDYVRGDHISPVVYEAMADPNPKSLKGVDTPQPRDGCYGAVANSAEYFTKQRADMIAEFGVSELVWDCNYRMTWGEHWDPNTACGLAMTNMRQACSRPRPCELLEDAHWMGKGVHPPTPE